MWFSKNQNYVAELCKDDKFVDIRAKSKSDGLYTKWADETVPSGMVIGHSDEDLIELRDFLNFLLDEKETV